MNEPLGGMPHAPYPPVAPKPSSRRDRSGGGGGGLQNRSSSKDSRPRGPRHQFSASGFDNAARSKQQKKQQMMLPSRVAFVPGQSDLYGAVNCAPDSYAADTDASSSSEGNRDKSSGAARIKSGPPLLEIRRLKYSLYHPAEMGLCDDEDNDRENEGGGEQDVNNQTNSKEGNEEKRIRINNQQGGGTKDEEGTEAAAATTHGSRRRRDQSSSLFQHETILISRGIPGLGGNVSSTCLDFRPLPSGSDEILQQQNQQHVQIQQQPVHCATGLTSGALCIHTLSNLYSGSDGSDIPSSTVAHYAPRQQRPATSVAWRPSENGDNSGGGGSSLVAIGLVGSSSAGGGPIPPPPGSAKSSSPVVFTGAGGVGGKYGMSGSRQSSLPSGLGGATSASAAAAASAVGSDREFGALVWDVEAQSGGGGGGVGGVGKSGSGTATIKTPLYRFAHNAGVESLSWLSDGQLLAVGCQKRNVQLYDLRVSGSNANVSPPISVFAHTEAVAGVVPDANCPNKMTFATFGRNACEPVKIWDARMMDEPTCEITPGGDVGAVAWSVARQGVLSIAVGDAIRNYDTRSPGSRALPVGVSYVDDDEEDVLVQCLALQPQVFHDGDRRSNPSVLYPHRTLAVSSQGRMKVLPESYAAPLAISKRDGRIANGLGGGTVWIGPTNEGPLAMEGQSILTEDVSARMMRRARCFHASRYSTDASDNVSMLEEEREKILAQELLHLRSSSQNRDKKSLPKSSKDFFEVISNIDRLLHCWRWIALVENLSIDQRGSDEGGGYPHSDHLVAWPAKGLTDAGVLKLLRMSSRDVADEGSSWMDNKSTSDTLTCDVFDSPLRRAALNACGWMKKYGTIQDLLDECENRGEFERSAALAIWHGDLNSCVSALQRGAEDVRALVEEESNVIPSPKSGVRGGGNASNRESYSETLSLIAMCVAGFNVTTASDGTKKSSKLWNVACDNLLRRPDISSTTESSSQVQLPGVAYLRSILLFLRDIGSGEAGFDKTIYNEGLSLADRVGFACRFLPRADLYSFLDASMRQCIELGNLEGLLITGLGRSGVRLLQSYMDRTSDVQTAALISCRAVLPTEWAVERRICTEWLESYRLLLNSLQMWHSRAAFDVGRFDHLRRLKQGGGATPTSGRHSKKQQKDKSQANNNFPPQLWARCNYCNASLPLSKLRRQEGIANSWLSRQKPVLSCCPQCKKPLPRCSICLLSLGCLNPYMELQRERNQYPRSGILGSGGGNIQGMEDLTGLASIPFATWFSWCMRCKHGGHAHHLCGWFEKNTTCAVSGCDCRCQFDGIEKLSRPGLQR